MTSETSVATPAAQKAHDGAEACLQTVADAVLLAATILVEGGCETKLAETAADGLGNAYPQVSQCTTFVMLTGVMVGIVGTDGSTVTRIARLDGVSHDIWSADRVIALRERCEREPLDPSDLLSELKAVREGPHFSPVVLGAASAAGAVGFAIFYGTTSVAALLCVGVVAWATQIAGRYASRLLPNSSLAILVQALIATAACCLCQRLWPWMGVDRLLIPVLMLLVPGMTLTTGILDTLSGNFLSATARLGKALLVGVAIAIGSAAVLHYTGVLSWSLS